MTLAIFALAAWTASSKNALLTSREEHENFEEQRGF
jgi:hypothetical protein